MLVAACNENGNNKATDRKHIVAGNDTIPAVRKVVNKKPVASYWVEMNAKLDRKFGVDVYETPYTFKYLLSMQYDAMPQMDSLEIPNFGKWPVIKIIPGKEKLSCIIGFLDLKGNFKEYKLLSAKNDQLKLSTLKYYSTANYYR